MSAKLIFLDNLPFVFLVNEFGFGAKLSSVLIALITLSE